MNLILKSLLTISNRYGMHFKILPTNIFELLHHFLTLYSTSHYQIGLPPTFSIGEVFGFDEELLAFIPQPVLGK